MNTIWLIIAAVIDFVTDPQFLFDLFVWTIPAAIGLVYAVYSFRRAGNAETYRRSLPGNEDLALAMAVEREVSLRRRRITGALVAIQTADLLAGVVAIVLPEPARPEVHLSAVIVSFALVLAGWMSMLMAVHMDYTDRRLRDFMNGSLDPHSPQVRRGRLWSAILKRIITPPWR